MSTQVVFKTDSKIKKKVMAQLKEEGITMKAFLNTCMKEYLAGKFLCKIHISQTDEIDFTDQGKNSGISAEELLKKMKKFEKQYGQN